MCSFVCVFFVYWHEVCVLTKTALQSLILGNRVRSVYRAIYAISEMLWDDYVDAIIIIIIIINDICIAQVRKSQCN